MVRKVTIEYEEDILLGLGLSPDQFSEEAKLLLAAKLYEQGRITSGQAGFAARSAWRFCCRWSASALP